MTTYIAAFNKSAKTAISYGLTPRLLSALVKYKSKFKTRDYYETLDSLGFSIGVEFMVQPVFDESSDLIASYIPSIKYHRGNPLTGKFEIKELSECSSINKAYRYMAKEHLYALMNIDDIETHLDL